MLIAGGYGGGTLSLKSAEIYDPATGKFTATGSMTVARRDATATLLVDGRVLIAGGLDQYATSALASAEVYDPATGKFTATGSMTAARSGFGAMGLEDGRVLVAGGRDATGAISESAEIYDPGTARFSPARVDDRGGRVDRRVAQGRAECCSSPAAGCPSTTRPVRRSVPSGIRQPRSTAATFAMGDVLLTEGGPAQVYLP